MIEEDLAVIASVREVILEVNFATQGNVATELVPLRQTHSHRLLEYLLGIKTDQQRRSMTTEKAYLDE